MPFLATSDYKKIKKNFFEELKDASQSKHASISFFKHTLPEEPLITNGLVQGIVVGGTNYIVATVEIENGQAKRIVQKSSGVLPIMDDSRTFENFLKEHLNLKAEAIGINFGFPLSPAVGPFGELDGVLRSGTKEHAFRGMIHESIGDIARDVLERRIPVTVANDTVCLALAGDDDEEGSLIAGTGFNMGLKYDDGTYITLVNLEAGNFAGFEPSDILKTIDRQSERPGTQRFEKCISGKYLAQYFDIKAQQMGLSIEPIQTSQELSELSQSTRDDKASHLARELLERSAKYVASALAGVYQFYGKKQITIVGEGSLLWKGWKYKEHIEQQLEALDIPHDGIVIKHVEASSLKGAIGLITK
jgi:hexokinase